MTQTLFVVAVLAFGPAIPQMAAAQGTGGTPGTTAAPAARATASAAAQPRRVLAKNPAMLYGF